MKRKNVFSIKLLSTALIVSMSIFSCNNNDTNDTTTTTSDTSTVMTPDTATMNKEPMMDTSTPAATTSTGMAKPNPAKKGLKGKATVTETPAAKSNANAKMEADNTGVYSNVEVIPSFPGGYKGLQKFFDDNLEYPAAASNDGVEGTVNVSFIVDETGKLTSPKVDGDKNGYGLEEEALRVVNKMPTWNPGKLKGKNVKTKFTLPVRFVLY